MSSYRFVHHFEYEDGSVIELRSDSKEPSTELLAQLNANGYDWIHTTRNLDL